MKVVAYLQKGTDKKKYKVTLINSDGTRKTVQFGASGYKDFTLHDKNVRDDKKSRYLKSHKKRENWNKSGLKIIFLLKKKQTPQKALVNSVLSYWPLSISINPRS